MEFDVEFYSDSTIFPTDLIVGEDGVGISSITQDISKDDGGENIITVKLTNGKTYKFTVLNGSKGNDGERGEQGEPGDLGKIEAGTMAFKITAVSVVKEKTITDPGETEFTLDSVDGLQVGYLCSVDCKNNYNGFGKITAISGNTITLDTSLPAGYEVEEDSVIWIPDHPELGTVKIGEGAYAFGVNNKANQKGAMATGENNIADGKRSFAAGKGNFVGYQDAAFGQNNTIKGLNSMANGDGNKVGANNAFANGHTNNVDGINAFANGNGNHANKDNAFVTGHECESSGINSYAGGYRSRTYKNNTHIHGTELRTSAENQTVFGKYNAPNSADLFEVGMGTSENDRKNAIAVSNEGDFTVHRNIKAGNSLNVGGNNVTGERAIAGGTGNHAVNNNTIVSGEGCAAGGKNSYAGGQYCETYKPNTFVHGTKLVTSAENQSAVGRYNTYSSKALFQVGNGTSSARSDALIVDDEGNLRVSGTITDGNGTNLSNAFPEMLLGVEYLTAERWQGKPVFVKTMDCGNLPDVNTMKYFSHGASATQIIRVEGCLSSGDTLPYYDPNYGDIRITATKGNVKIFTVSAKDASTFADVSAYATIYYVKE